MNYLKNIFLQLPFVKTLIELSHNLDTSEGKNIFILYFSDLFFLFMSFVYQIIYLFTSKAMSIINILAIIFVLYGYELLKKKEYDKYTNFMFAEVPTYTCVAISIMGWRCGFQFLFLAATCAFFLPFYNHMKKSGTKKKVFIRGILYICLFFVMYYIMSIEGCPIVVKLTPEQYAITYFVNILITVISISAYCYFYSFKSIQTRIELSRRADFDALTNIYNRYALNAILNNDIELAQGKDEELAVAMIDIDHFKKINDTYGHNAGDVILKSLANILLKNMSHGIHVGRWGGEEFVLIASNINYFEFNNIINNVREIINNYHFIAEGKQIHVSISAGATKYKPDMSPLELIESADNNLYKAKENGRNQVVTDCMKI